MLARGTFLSKSTCKVCEVQQLKPCFNAATLLLSTALLAIGSLEIQESAAEASTFAGIAPSSSPQSADPTQKQADWNEKPELYGHLLSSDKSLPDDELLDITNLEPVPGTPLLSPQLLDESHDLHQQLSSFKLPYSIDSTIGHPLESLEEEEDGPLVTPEASDVVVGPNADTSSDITAEPDTLLESSPPTGL